VTSPRLGWYLQRVHSTPLDPPDASNRVTVVTTVSRWDLVKLNFLVTPSLPSTWISLGFVAMLTCGVWVTKEGIPITARAFLVLLIAVVLATAVFFAFLLVFSLGLVLLSPSRGVLGEHLFSVQSDGLREQTTANDTLIKWGGAQDLVRTSAFILIRVAPALCHVLPRRNFVSQSEFDTFWISIQPLKHERRPTQV
jgi:hypothetical protein